MNLKAQLILSLSILILAAGLMATAYACQRQTNEFNKSMADKGWCWTLVANTNVWVWRPCDTKGER